MFSFILVASSVYALGMSQPVWARSCGSDVLSANRNLVSEVKAAQSSSRSGMARLASNESFLARVHQLDENIQDPIEFIEQFEAIYFDEIIRSLPESRQAEAREVLNEIFETDGFYFQPYAISERPAGIYASSNLTKKSKIGSFVLKAHEFTHYLQVGVVNMTKVNLKSALSALKIIINGINPLPERTYTLFKHEKEAMHTEWDILSMLPERIKKFGYSEIAELLGNQSNKFTPPEKSLLNLFYRSLKKQRHWTLLNLRW